MNEKHSPFSLSYVLLFVIIGGFSQRSVRSLQIIKSIARSQLTASHRFHGN